MPLYLFPHLSESICVVRASTLEEAVDILFKEYPTWDTPSYRQSRAVDAVLLEPEGEPGIVAHQPVG